MRDRNLDLLLTLGTETQNHKGFRFVANSENLQLRMVSHELGFIGPWSGHIPRDPSKDPRWGKWKHPQRHLVFSSKAGTAHSSWPGQRTVPRLSIKLTLVQLHSTQNSLCDLRSAIPLFSASHHIFPSVK